MKILQNKLLLIISYVIAATNSHSLTSLVFDLDVNKTKVQLVVLLRNLKAVCYAFKWQKMKSYL